MCDVISENRMNRRITLAIVAIILMSTLLALTKYPTDFEFTVHAEGGISVGGILWDNTTWALANSPYAITSTVQIPENVTLTIEPGVVVNTQLNDDMFLLHGVIVAQGTVDEKIVFDGGSTASFFNAEGSTADSFLDMDNCVVRNGKRFWWEGHGYFSLRNSELIDLTGFSYIWYPENAVLIEHNTFRNTAGFSIGTDDANVSVINNFFTENSGFVIENWASYYSSKTIVKFNSFLDMEGVVLKLLPSYSTAAMNASDNYWGTNDTSEIDSMIYDMNDDITCAGFIDYLPILLAPHPDTPIIPDLPSNMLTVLVIISLSAGALVYRKKLLKNHY